MLNFLNIIFLSQLKLSIIFIVLHLENLNQLILQKFFFYIIMIFFLVRIIIDA